MLPHHDFFQTPIAPFFYAIPGIVYSHYQVEQLREEVNERMAQIEKPHGQRFVHNGFREAHRRHYL